MGTRMTVIVHVCLVCLVMALALPAAALAAPATAVLQQETMDPEVRAAALAAVAVTAPYGVQTGAASGADRAGLTQALRPQTTPVPEEEETPAPEEEATPAPDEEETPAPEEEATPAPDEEEAAPPVDLSERVEYSSGGITLQAPAVWDVSEGVSDSVFDIFVPGTDFYGALQDAGGEFPGLMGLVLFATQADMLLSQYLGEANLTTIELTATDQGVPMVEIAFDADFDGLAGSGAFYLLAPGANAYLLLAFAPSDQWSAQSEALDLVARSIVFDGDLLTLVTAEDGDLVFGDEAGILELTLPQDWHASDTSDPTLPAVVANPALDYVAAIGTDATLGSEMGEEMAAIFGAGGEADPETIALLVDELLAGMDASGEDMQIDPELTEVYTRDGGATVRLVGDADMGDGMALPVAIYFDLRADGGAALIVFGDVELALEDEAALRAIAESVVLLE